MKITPVLLMVLTLTFALHSAAFACSFFTLTGDGVVLFGNNEDFVKPGYVWFVPGKKGRYGRVNFGFDDYFAQGSMNEKGLCFDGAALAPVAWKEVPGKDSPTNLVDKIMNECATVDEAIAYFERYNCRFLANSQLMFADATGASAVVAWLPESGLSVVRKSGPYQIVTNNRLEASGYRCARFVKAERILAERGDASLETVVAALDAVHQRGPHGFTTYSTVYDLKNKKVYVYNLANFETAYAFDLVEELKQRGRKRLALADLFPNGPDIASVRDAEPRTRWNTGIDLDDGQVARFEGVYQPVNAPDVTVRVERDGAGGLRVVHPGQGDATLYPESETKFRIAPDRGQVTFHVAPDGAVTGLTLHKQTDVYAKRVDGS